MGKKHKQPSDSDDIKAKKKQKTSHASSSSKSPKDGKSMLSLKPCSQSQANLNLHKEKSQKPDEDEQIVSRNELEEMNKSSNPTNVETTGASSSKSGNSLMLKPCLQSQANLKIHKEKSQKRDEDEQIVSRSEFEEMKKSIKELSRAMVNLQGILVTKAELLELSLKEKETAERREEETLKKKEEAKFTCCFDCEDAFGNNEDTIFVKGFENLRPREEIMKELREIFGSCGKVTRVFVTIECKKRLPLGFAFINLKNGEGNDKALELSGSYMGEKELKVSMAKNNGEYYGFTNFEGCDRCPRPHRFRKPPRYDRIHIDRHA